MALMASVLWRRWLLHWRGVVGLTAISQIVESVVRGWMPIAGVGDPGLFGRFIYESEHPVVFHLPFGIVISHVEHISPLFSILSQDRLTPLVAVKLLSLLLSLSGR